MKNDSQYTYVYDIFGMQIGVIPVEPKQSEDVSKQKKTKNKGTLDG